MEEFKGTKGKWYIVDYAGYLQINDAPYYDARNIQDCDKVGEEIAHANAKLISAAPDLLQAALDFIKKVDDGKARSTDSYNKFKTAVNKALGL